MKKIIFLLSLVLSFYAMAGTDADMIKALEAQGFSSADIEVIAKIVLDRDTGISAMKNGVVKFYNETKGMGLVFVEDGTYLVFEASTKLKINDLVVFEVQEGKKGLNAVNVKRVIAIQDENKGFSSLIR